MIRIPPHTDNDIKTWFNQLPTGRGNKKGHFKAGMNKCKITLKELRTIKQAKNKGMTKKEIIALTGLSHYIVTGAMSTRYDHILTRHSDTTPPKAQR